MNEQLPGPKPRLFELQLEIKNYTDQKLPVVNALLATIAGDFDFTLLWKEGETRTLTILVNPRLHIVMNDRRLK